MLNWNSWKETPPLHIVYGKQPIWDNTYGSGTQNSYGLEHPTRAGGLCRSWGKYVGVARTGVDISQSMAHEAFMSSDQQSTSFATPGTGINPGSGNKVLVQARSVSNWLLALCFMVFAMVVLGGVTRLTHSGLSMVDWRPITGWLPPMNDGEWSAVFELYKQSPEYAKMNLGMTVDGFKSIFWLEFIHRLVGRAIGLVFLLPFLFFLFRGWLDRRIIPMLSFFFILGGLQGVLGWYMVKSGLVDEPDVSQYRLTAHLGLAVLIYAFMFRFALRLRQGFDSVRPMVAPGLVRLRRVARVLPFIVFLTLLSGGLVAGLDAGFTYNTFPLMEGMLIPDQLYDGSPAIMSAFEDIMTVQFNHRWLAIATLVVIGIFWTMSLRCRLGSVQRRAMNLLILAVIGQVGLGIATLLMVVPVALGAMHQAGAVVLLSATIYALHTIEWGHVSK